MISQQRALAQGHVVLVVSNCVSQALKKKKKHSFCNKVLFRLWDRGKLNTPSPPWPKSREEGSEKTNTQIHFLSSGHDKLLRGDCLNSTEDFIKKTLLTNNHYIGVHTSTGKGLGSTMSPALTHPFFALKTPSERGEKVICALPDCCVTQRNTRSTRTNPHPALHTLIAELCLPLLLPLTTRTALHALPTSPFCFLQLTEHPLSGTL